MIRFFKTIADRTRQFNDELHYENDWTLVRSGFWIGVILGTLAANIIATVLTLIFHG